jgi:hypothetical protein
MKGASGYDPYADPAFLASRRTSSCLKRMIELGEYSTRIIEEGAPGIGELNAARSSMEELHIKFTLNRLDPLTEGGLLHAKALRSPRDVLFLGDGDEIPEVSQLHLSYLPRYEFRCKHMIDRRPIE